GRQHGWTAGRLDRSTAGRLDGWTAARLDGWTAGPQHGWTAGRLDGWTAARLGSTGRRSRGRAGVDLLVAAAFPGRCAEPAVGQGSPRLTRVGSELSAVGGRGEAGGGGEVGAQVHRGAEAAWWRDADVSAMSICRCQRLSEAGR
ncbi:hypothetical protein AB0H54_24905, partial [Nocardia sp. NPDC050718]